MKNIFLLIFPALLLINCSTHKKEATSNHITDQPKPKRLTEAVVTIANAEISLKNPNGEDWGSSEDSTSGIFEAVKNLAWGYATYKFPIASAIRAFVDKPSESSKDSKNSKSSPAPNPFVKLSYGPKTMVIPLKTETTSPSWNYPFLFIAPDVEFIAIEVLNAFVKNKRPVAENIGSKTIRADEFRKVNLLNLQFGGVKKLVIKVEKYSDSYKKKISGIHVDGTKEWTDTGIAAIAGQKVKISGAGKVCASGNHCCGPEGFPLPKWRFFSIIKDESHAGLIAKIGDRQMVFVGKEAQITASEGGGILLGVNDNQLSNNSGAYTAKVEIH